MSLPTVRSVPTNHTFLPRLARARAVPMAGFLLPQITTWSPMGLVSHRASCRVMTLSPSAPQKVGLRTVEPVASTTVSGSSSSIISAVTSWPKWYSTPRWLPCAMWKSMMPYSSSSLYGALPASMMVPPGCIRLSHTCTSWPRSAATHAASRPAGPPPTIQTVFLLLAGCG